MKDTDMNYENILTYITIGILVPLLLLLIPFLIPFMFIGWITVKVTGIKI